MFFCLDHAAAEWNQFRGHHWRTDEVDEATAAFDKLISIYCEQAKKWGWRRVSAVKAGNDKDGKKAAKNENTFLDKIAKLRYKQYRRNTLVLAAAGEGSLGITGREWDRNRFLVPFANGVLDLSARCFRDGRPDDFCKVVSPTPWEGFDAQAPRWDQFLGEIFGGDSTLIDYVRRLFGYSIAGLTVEHVLAILYGPGGRNGKTTLIEVLQCILGPLAAPIQTELLLEQRTPRSSGGPSADIMALRGLRVAFCSESDEGRKLNSGRVKSLVGGDMLTGRNPYGHREVAFRPTHTIFLLTNYKPRIDPADNALWERIHLIPFEISFVDNPVEPHQRPKDKFVAEKLKAEAPGIAAWLARGFMEWQENGLRLPAKVLESTQAYRKDSDLMEQFLEDKCIVAEGAFCGGAAIFEAYKSWCEELGLKPKRNKFYEKLNTKFQKVITNKGVFYQGVGLKAEG